MAERLILCSLCGAKNRILPNGIGQPKCGSCGKELVVPSYQLGRPKLFKKPLTWLVIAGIVFGGYLWLQEQKSSRLRTTGDSYTDTLYTPKSAKPSFDVPSVPASHGVLQWPSTPGVSPLGIKTQYGNDYYVKLVDMGGRTIMTMYIEGGRYFEGKVPLGTFEMRYASGKTWYGTKYYFGPETVYAKADKLLNFTSNSSGYSGYTVELILQRDGNLRTSPISRVAF